MDFHEALARLREIKDDVSVDLTDDNFETMTTSGEWFVYFYHPDCMRCQIFGP
jgi:hypothetical protein